MPCGEFKHRYWFFATLQTPQGLLALFEKIYYGEPIFTDFSHIGENVQYRFFN